MSATRHAYPTVQLSPAVLRVFASDVAFSRRFKMSRKARNNTMHADGGEILPRMTPLELRTRKRFVGLDLAAIKALQALRPWMEAHVQEVVEEFYAHLLRFQQPRWLLADAPMLARVKAAQTDYLRSLTEGAFDMAYVANRLAIGRTHARVGVTPQWYLGAYSIFARLLFPRILGHYRDRPLTGMAAVKALIAAMHLDMQLAIDAYLEASQETLQHQAISLEEEVSIQTSALQERARQLETLYLISATASRELDLGKVLGSTLPLIVEIIGAAGAEVHLMDDEGGLTWAASHGLAESFVAASRALRLRPDDGIPGQALATMAPVLVEDPAQEPHLLRREATLASGYVAVLCTPLIAQGTPVGVLQLYASDEYQYSAALLPLVQAISEQLAVAIANAHLHQSVRASEAEYRSLVENTPRLIFRLDLDGHCIFVNRTLHIMLGWPSHTVVSAARLRDFLGHPDDWPEAALTRARQGEIVQGVECRLRHHDGSWRWCQLTVYPWQRGDERILGVEGVAEDITERKRLAQEMARSERLALAGQLASGLAHEIGTPLNVIAGTAEFLLSDLPEDDPRRADMEIIGQEAHRVADLVRRLLGLVRERGEMRAQVEVHGLLDHTLRLLEYRLQKEHITVVKQYTPNLPPVWGVRQELEQVVLNLFINAWHAMPDGGTITITTLRLGAQARIDIADTGCGIPEAHMTQLFEPFFTTKPPEQGTGLGLAVAHQLIAGHGGRIEIASQVNQGTTVTVTLPLAEEAHDA
jgi:two-component system NtrC family sensor kinase